MIDSLGYAIVARVRGQAWFGNGPVHRLAHRLPLVHAGNVYASHCQQTTCDPSIVRGFHPPLPKVVHLAFWLLGLTQVPAADAQERQGLDSGTPAHFGCCWCRTSMISEVIGRKHVTSPRVRPSAVASWARLVPRRGLPPRAQWQADAVKFFFSALILRFPGNSSGFSNQDAVRTRSACSQDALRIEFFTCQGAVRPLSELGGRWFFMLRTRAQNVFAGKISVRNSAAGNVDLSSVFIYLCK
jgi:hypothetical protein